MRARLTYLLLSPSTPARVAGWTTDLLVLLAAVAGLVAVVAGYSPVVLLGHVIVTAGDVFGVQA